MILKPLAKNKTVLNTEKAQILFSYSTPVAAIFNNSDEVWKTSTKYSKTTTKHINSWLHENGKESLACEVDQKYLDRLVD